MLSEVQPNNFIFISVMPLNEFATFSILTAESGINTNRIIFSKESAAYLVAWVVDTFLLSRCAGIQGPSITIL